MTATDIWSYLAGLEYPASKADAVACAEAAGAPQGQIELLQSVEGERFTEPEALRAALAPQT